MVCNGNDADDLTTGAWHPRACTATPMTTPYHSSTAWACIWNNDGRVWGADQTVTNPGGGLRRQKQHAVRCTKRGRRGRSTQMTTTSRKKRWTPTYDDEAGDHDATKNRSALTMKRLSNGDDSSDDEKHETTPTRKNKRGTRGTTPDDHKKDRGTRRQQQPQQEPRPRGRTCGEVDTTTR